jgi:hypothetical protein
MGDRIFDTAGRRQPEHMALPNNRVSGKARDKENLQSRTMLARFLRHDWVRRLRSWHETEFHILGTFARFIITAVATHLVMSFSQTLMHYKVGHRSNRRQAFP